MTTTNLNMNVSVTTSDFRDSTGHRGRPQRHPQVTIDLSGADALVAEHGAKKVRNHAFRALRSQLGLGSDVVCSEHPKNEGVWILKALMDGRQNFHVTVTPGEASVDKADETSSTEG